MHALGLLGADELKPGAIAHNLRVLRNCQHDIAKLRGAEAARLLSDLPA